MYYEDVEYVNEYNGYFPNVKNQYCDEFRRPNLYHFALIFPEQNTIFHNLFYIFISFNLHCASVFPKKIFSRCPFTKAFLPNLQIEVINK